MSKQQAMLSREELSCPICSFNDADEYALRLHVEHVHFSGGEVINEPALPTVVDAIPRLLPELVSKGKAATEYVICTFEGCGEEVISANLQEHLDFHIAERLSLEEEAAKFNADGESPWTFDGDLQDSGVDLAFGDSRDGSPQEGELDVRRWAHLDQNTGRLGILSASSSPKENETKISTIGTNGLLVKGVQTHVNRTKNVVSLLGGLLAADVNVKEAWLCSGSVQYIYKLKGEGSFCGYRNMQMMLSYVVSSATGLSLPSPNGHISGRTQCCKDFIDVDGTNGIPHILHLQDLIETAWDHGINPGGRVETGGIIGTRKYIGTPEAYALFQFLRLKSWSVEISQTGGNGDLAAYARLLQKVEDYFKHPPSARTERTKGLTGSISRTATSHRLAHETTVHHTQLPPIYLQALGHSVTIIGLEVAKDGTRNLLVFDPSYGPGKDVSKMLVLADKQAVSSTSTETSKFFSKHNAEDSASTSTHVLGSLSSHTSTASSQSTKRKREEAESTSELPLRRLKTAHEQVTDKVTPDEARRLLLPYRRGEKHLSRNNTFELLMLGSL